MFNFNYFNYDKTFVEWLPFISCLVDDKYFDRKIDKLIQLISMFTLE